MTDVFTKEKRSYVMSKIRSKNTKIEIIMKELLTRNKINFTMHPKIFGTPDFLVGKNTVVFCDGDFWHGYDYRNGLVPPQKFWKEKIERNMERDKKVSRKLRKDEWLVIRLWEHDINRRPEFCMRKIKHYMKK